MTPIELPAIVRTPARQPPRIALRTTIAVAAPGVIVTSAAIGTKAQSMKTRIDLHARAIDPLQATP